jgi:predicted transcriptional regulator
MKKEDKREMALMNLLWDAGGPITSVEIFDCLTDVMENITYTHRTITSLLNKGMIVVSGMERVNTQYARTFTFAVSREEYAARKIAELGVGIDRFGDVAMALVKEKLNFNKSNKETIIEELKEVISKLEE